MASARDERAARRALLRGADVAPPVVKRARATPSQSATAKLVTAIKHALRDDLNKDDVEHLRDMQRNALWLSDPKTRDCPASAKMRATIEAFGKREATLGACVDAFEEWVLTVDPNTLTRYETPPPEPAAQYLVGGESQL